MFGPAAKSRSTGSKPDIYYIENSTKIELHYYYITITIEIEL